MWDYTEKVKDHFFQPRNAGVLPEANAVGEVGSIACGDALRLMLKVEPETEVIVDARFQTFGCGSAIASSSALTEIIKGMTLDEAAQVTNQQIVDYLDGLPPEKMHCSVMGREALQAAVANFRGETLQDDHEEGELVCKCFGVHGGLIEEVVCANRLSSVDDVTNYTKAGGGCSSCHEQIEDLLARVAKNREAKVRGEASAGKKPAAPLVRWSAMTMPQRVKRVEAVLEKIRPQLQADHGDAEQVEIIDKTIYVSMQGACNGCSMEHATLGGIQQRVLEEFGEFVKVLPASRVPAVTAAAGEASRG